MAVVEEVEEESEVRTRAEALKTEGNAHFATGKWEEATRCYDEALELLSRDEEKPLQAVIHNNKVALSYY